MYQKPKKTALSLFIIISFLCSKIVFWVLSIGDPEGSNLLIVTMGALVIFSIFLLVHFLLTTFKKVDIKK